jgi:transposase
VIAPALIPRRPGDRIKTDRRDAGHPVILCRTGALTPIHIPTEQEEAARDLTAFTIAAELGDPRRFATAPRLMAFVGLIPSGPLTKVSPYQFAVAVGASAGGVRFGAARSPTINH